jgi:hypothetical protein
MNTERKADVLAVMAGDAADALYWRREADADRGKCAMEESLRARMIVAELIEAAKTIATRTDWATQFGCHSGECATCLLEAALSRLGASA